MELFPGVKYIIYLVNESSALRIDSNYSGPNLFHYAVYFVIINVPFELLLSPHLELSVISNTEYIIEVGNTTKSNMAAFFRDV